MDSHGIGTSENPGHRRSHFAAAALVSVVAVLLLGGLAWRYTRRAVPSTWNHSDITAHFADLTVERDHRNVHVLLRYDLVNHTGKPWLMPPPGHGALMRRLPDGDLHEVDSVQWDPVTIPAGKTAQVTYDLLIDPTNRDIPPGELRENLSAFANRHLQRIQGLAFLDYNRQDFIDLPRGWNAQAPLSQTGPPAQTDKDPPPQSDPE